MPRVKGPAYFGFVLLSMFLLASVTSRQALQAQDVQSQNSPAAGTTVVVRMIDAVDSGSDPAGKAYRSSVTQPVNAGNGVTITQGAAATVTLASNGSGWVAQLSSVVINGQAVAVTSSSASVTSTAQNAVGSVANAASSVLKGFGRPRNVPPSVAAVATGARVVLPPGTTLSFVLSATLSANAAPPAANSTPASPPPVASAPPTANIAPSPAAASGNSAGGHLTAMNICYSNPPPTPSDPNHETQYLTAVFEVPVDTQGAIPALEPAFSAYLKATYQYPSAGITCQPIWTIKDAQSAQKSIIANYTDPRLKRVETGWRYGQPPLTQGQSGFDPLAQGSGGLNLSQHRLTTYFCSFTAPGGTTMAVDQNKPNWNANMTTYVSPVFQADWDSAPVSMAYNVYIRDHYVHDLPLSDLSPRCSAQSPAMQAMMHQTAMISNKRIGHAVPVDFTDTPAQAAAANVAIAAAPARPAAAPTTGSFIACSTSGGAGIDTYLTGVFQTAKPVRMMPNGAYPVDQAILDRFYAYLTQEGYKFKPGSASGCAVGTTEAEAEAAKHKRYYEGGGCSTCGKTVETGWKDE